MRPVFQVMESSLISILAKVSCLVSPTALLPYYTFPQRMLPSNSKEGKGKKLGKSLQREVSLV